MVPEHTPERGDPRDAGSPTAPADNGGNVDVATRETGTGARADSARRRLNVATPPADPTAPTLAMRESELAGDSDSGLDLQLDQRRLTLTLGLEPDAGAVLPTDVPTDGTEPPSSASGSDGSDGSTGAASTGGKGGRLDGRHFTPAEQRYEVRRELARGGMGAIMVARDHDLRRNVAMKVLLDPKKKRDRKADARRSRNRLSRFLEEAQITGQLEHPNIVPVHDIGVDTGGRPYFTMKLVKGEALSDILGKLRSQQPGDPPYKGFTRARLLEVFSKACDAVAYSHSRGVIHRDLKPANIMVGAFGEVLVMDWGIAKVMAGAADSTGDGETGRSERGTGRTTSGATRRRGISRAATRRSGLRPSSRTGVIDAEHAPKVLGPDGDEQVDSHRAADGVVTLDGAVIGTPAYMAPEQARGELELVSERADVYAMGAILFEVLTLTPPYEGRSPVEVLNAVQSARTPEPPSRRAPGRDIPAELEAICQKAMSRSPRQRYAGVDALKDDITRYHDGMPISVFRDTVLGRSIKWIRRNRIQTVSIAAALMIGLTLIITMAITLEAHGQRLASYAELADANERAISAEEAARSMAEALVELDRIRLQARAGGAQEQVVTALEALCEKAPGLYPAVFELAGQLDRLGRIDDGSAVLATLRDNRDAPANVRAAAATALGMRAIQHTVQTWPDSVEDLRRAAPHFSDALGLAEQGTPAWHAAAALEAVATAAIVADSTAHLEAIRQTREATDRCPDMWEPWYALARTLALPLSPARGDYGWQKQIDPAAVVAACRHILEVHPGHVPTQRLLARFTLHVADIAWLRERSDSPALQILEARARRLDGDLEAARACVTDVVDADPGNGWAWLELAECAVASNRPQIAEDALNHTSQLLGETTDILRLRGRIAQEFAHNLTDANDAYCRVLDIRPHDLPARGLRGMVLAADGHYAIAEADLDFCISQNPTAAAHDARARVRMATGRAQDAFDDWRESVKLEPWRLTTWITWISAQANAGYMEDAQKTVFEAVSVAPPSVAAEIQQMAQFFACYQLQTAQRPDRDVERIRRIGRDTLEDRHSVRALRDELALTVVQASRRAPGGVMGLHGAGMPGYARPADAAAAGALMTLEEVTAEFATNSERLGVLVQRVRESDRYRAQGEQLRGYLDELTRRADAEARDSTDDDRRWGPDAPQRQGDDPGAAPGIPDVPPTMLPAPPEPHSGDDIDAGSKPDDVHAQPGSTRMVRFHQTGPEGSANRDDLQFDSAPAPGNVIRRERERGREMVERANTNAELRLHFDRTLDLLASGEPQQSGTAMTQVRNISMHIERLEGAMRLTNSQQNVAASVAASVQMAWMMLMRAAAWTHAGDCANALADLDKAMPMLDTSPEAVYLAAGIYAALAGSDTLRPDDWTVADCETRALELLRNPCLDSLTDGVERLGRSAFDTIADEPAYRQRIESIAALGKK